MRLLRQTILPLAVVALLAVPAGAAGSAQQIYGDYQSGQGISPCKYSASDLRQSIGQVPADVQQYDPAFLDELDRGLSTHATGGCEGGSSGSGKHGTGALEKAAEKRKRKARLSPGGEPRPPLTAGPAELSLTGDRDTPTALIGLGIALFLSVLLGGIALLGRWYGWDLERVYGPPLDRLGDAGRRFTDRIRFRR
jgi:hypothetical protein